MNSLPRQHRLLEVLNRVVRRLRSIFPVGSGANRLQPERRSGVRIFTFKNAGWLALAVTVLFVVFSVWMEFRSRDGSGFGRLYDRRMEATNPPPAARRPEVVHEAPGPTLDGPRQEPARGNELLGVTDSATRTETTASAAPAVRPPVRLRRGGGRVVVSGGAAGVRVDVQPAPQPQPAKPPPPEETPATTTDPPPMSSGTQARVNL
ncbi:MAG TPA: hypothetical protein VEK57_00765 [Thermoanaerobaculia bacterium]|nr:hypothetical protein [Thermoanaerobaculia bacterium]